MKISKGFYLIFLYPFLLFLFACLPINNESDTLNHTYIQNIRLDHVFHGLFFFPWMFLPTLFSEKKSFENIKFPNLIWLLGGLMVAVLTEGIQYFLKYRSFTLTDLLFNISGLLLGWLCLTVLKASCNSLKKN